MSDRRATPATERVAHISLRGTLDRPAFTAGTPARIGVPLTDLCRTPAGARERQLLLGAAVTVIDAAGEWRFVQAARDGYCGWVAHRALAFDAPAPTHRVAAAASHVYPAPDLKTPEIAALSLGAEVAVTGTEARFARLATGGFVPLQHLADTPDADPVAVALRFLGTPYLWGGNSRAGIDCSGLVQAALTACGTACPGDSDQQADAFPRLPDDAPLAPGDLLFWTGHVAMAVDAASMIHANAHAMAVTREGIAAAKARIAEAFLGVRRPR